MMNRRAFLAIVAGGVPGPFVAHAQQAGKIWRLGVLTTGPRNSPVFSRYYEALVHELRGLGYREGQNLVIDWHHTEGSRERRQTEAAALVQKRPDAVVTGSATDALDVHDANKRVPIVVAASGDLVAVGLAASVSRPGGSVTGMEILAPDLMGKRLQFIKEVVPKLERVALLHSLAPNRQEITQHHDLVFAEVQAAARAMSVEAVRFLSPGLDDLDRTFAAMKGQGVHAVLVAATPATVNNASRLAELALRYRLPDGHAIRQHVDAGSLLSYGVDPVPLYRRTAHYVDRIFKGGAPGDLPIERATRFELAINLETAKTLGLTVPPSLLARADHVLQ
jgi:putative ABC transport system substrate-binding protein